jgi:CRISPR-associated protein Cas4
MNECISVTDLSSYLFCPRLFYRERVMGMVRLNAAMAIGSVRHNFHDLANKDEEQIILRLAAPGVSDETLAAYSDAYKRFVYDAIRRNFDLLSQFDIPEDEMAQKMMPLALAEAAERAGNVSSFAQRSLLSGKELWQALSPKIFSELKVKSTALKLKGVVDRIEISEGIVLPIELKTGKMPKEGVWPSHRVQAAAYMMLLQEKYQMPVQKAIVRYLDHHVDKPVSLNEYMELEVKELTEKVIELLKSELMPEPCGRADCRCYFFK